MAKLTQDELLQIFRTLKALIVPYERGTVKARINMEGKYDLWSEKPLVAAGRKYDAVSFATLIIQSSFVGFYFMPVYTCGQIKEAIPPGLLKQLKGKACFHIKSTDASLMHDVEEALRMGYEAYAANEWV